MNETQIKIAVSMRDKYFKDTPITSVVIPINEEFYMIKVGIKPQVNLGIDTKNGIQTTLLNSNYSNNIKNNLLKIYSILNDDIVSNSNIQKILNIKETAATKYIKHLVELKSIYLIRVFALLFYLVITLYIIFNIKIIKYLPKVPQKV